VQHTLTAPYNNLPAVEELFEKSKAKSNNKTSQIAAIIIEPMAANMGLVLPAKGFLEGLRNLCNKHGAVLIFDEVMTGFRISKHGAAEAFGVQPDMWTLGKIVGGGLPAAAYGGRADIMAMVSPLGKAYQAGTLSGNPMAMAAGLATLKQLTQENFYSNIEKIGESLDAAVQKHLSPWKDKFCYLRKSSFFGIFFGTTKPPQNFTEVSQCDMASFGKIYKILLEEGIYLGPSGYEVGFFGATHTPQEMERFVLGIQKGLKAVYGNAE
jgi:glutamate-1-semialdehyde 2,1-aminomutase